jgi:hypothetical protein
MAASRRSLLIAAAAVPVAFAALQVDVALRGLGRALRPPSIGTSATRCAACGSVDHAMLDPECPAAPRVRPGARA